jgi:hypothetical protein
MATGDPRRISSNSGNMAQVTRQAEIRLLTRICMKGEGPRPNLDSLYYYRYLDIASSNEHAVSSPRRLIRLDGP